MSWSLKLAVVLGIFAISATAKSVQINNDDMGESAMTAEEEEFLMKMATVILKAQAAEQLGLAAGHPSLEKLYPTGGQCSASGNVAKCCFNFGFDIKLGFFSQRVNLDGCVSAEYLPDNIGVRLVATINGDRLIDKEISATNPPPICVAIPGVRKLASVCVKISDISISSDGSNFHACFDISAKAVGYTLGRLDLGCITAT